MNAVFLAKDNCEYIGMLFDQTRRNRIARAAELYPTVLTPKNLPDHMAAAAQAEIIFSSWGLPEELLSTAYFPALKVLFYSAGSVKTFGGDLLRRGVQVVSARSANAIPVAQFSLGQIILSCKGYFRNTRMCRQAANMHSLSCYKGPGIYQEKIALLGMGAVGRELARLLKGFDFEVLAVDPYLGENEAAEIGVEIVSMETAFAQAFVVSNHLPNLPELRHVLNGKLFQSMRPDATFLNTGRGAQVNEGDLIDVAHKRPDLIFLLDVTDPEPPKLHSLLYALPNVQLSSHIAGSLTNEWHRMSDLVIEDFERYVNAQPMRHTLSLEGLERLA